MNEPGRLLRVRFVEESDHAPDGYYWEIAYWDGWKFDANDMLVIEKPSS